MPPYSLPANSGFSPFQIDWWTCMPLPLSPKIGFGMNVAVLPCFQATFLTMYLYHISASPICSSGRKRMSISAWPAVATSWCCFSTRMPTDSIMRHISVRMSCWVSLGGTGK
jgi:hypothetical protein